MEQLTARELRARYLKFFEQRGHAVIPSASLIPENDPTVLFTTAGMHPLVPYLSGEKHPAGTRLVNVQKCVRTGDIDEVGDASHCTFFEMLGNWSLGDYFKDDSIKWSYEFLTNELKIPSEILVVSVFEGDADCLRDEESASIWASLGIAREKIFYLPKKNNWWGPAGTTGPCGPDTEIFIDTGKPSCSADCSPACSCGKYLEIWNNVFMEYYKNADGSYSPLAKKNVDTGMGLERTVCVLNGLESVYETELFAGAVARIESLSGKKAGTAQARAIRIVADHVRTAVMLIGDTKGVTPSNVDQGYVLRRLIRRAVRYGRQLEFSGALSAVAEEYIKVYGAVYPEIGKNGAKIISELDKEESRFKSALQQGLKEFEKVISYLPVKKLSGKAAFRLYDTYGFPIEMTVELAQEIGYEVDVKGYHKAFEEHQAKSQAGAKQRFKGGLSDNTEAVTRLHTATHLLLAALKKLLSCDIDQRGSNITAERLRFDFNYDRPLTDLELRSIEAAVNEVIAANAPITCEEMTVEQAQAEGATGVFKDRYGELVKVYTVEGCSKEICGGPHAKSTGELGKFRIVKEQSSSAGVRRIKAVLE